MSPIGDKLSERRERQSGRWPGSQDADLPILRHYADDVEFTANTLVRRWQRPEGILRGRDELREHFRRGLELAPQVTFVLEEVFTCPGATA
jgi:hypothetical protein